MKCMDCPDYKTCRRQNDLRRKRHKCKKANEPFVQTNADRFRAMSDEELAWITVREIKVWNYVEGYFETKYKCSDGYVTDDHQAAIDHEVEWLRQPVKDGDNE